MHTWNVELSAYGDGFWFVYVSEAITAVILPPGARFHMYDRRHGIEDGSAGWRRALWHSRRADHRPTIDRDLPDEVCEIDTRTVLEILTPELHELVWDTLRAQLRHARVHGRAARNHARPEDAARAGALAVRWLEDEMRNAFPDRAGQLDKTEPSDVWATPCAIPDTPAELLALLPRPGGREMQPALGKLRELVDVSASLPVAAPGTQQLLLVLVASFDSPNNPDDPFAVPRRSVDIR